MTVLLFIATIVIFLTIDHIRQRRAKPALIAQPSKAIPMRTPAGIFFSKSHTWLSLFPSGNVQLGIDDFVARMFTTPQIALLKNRSEPVHKGEPIMRIAEGDNEVVVRSPIDGVISNVNANLPVNPGILSESLFSEGWAYTIAPAHVSEVRKLYLGEDTKVWLKEEMAKLRDFFVATAPAPALLQDGGLPAVGIINNLNAEQCKKFEDEFLQVA